LFFLIGRALTLERGQRRVELAPSVPLLDVLGERHQLTQLGRRRLAVDRESNQLHRVNDVTGALNGATIGTHGDGRRLHLQRLGAVVDDLEVFH
jgi:hypothetical protein